MTEHCCGPTREQIQDAFMRGDVIGTWPRCPECVARERQILDKTKVYFLSRRDWDAKFEPLR